MGRKEEKMKSTIIDILRAIAITAMIVAIMILIK
jgi:hypothetical protein